MLASPPPCWYGRAVATTAAILSACCVLTLCPFGRVEELDDQRSKLALRLQEAEEQLESLHAKNGQLEKLKSRLSGELEDMHLEVDRAQQLAIAMEKKARNFDKVGGVTSLGAWDDVRGDDGASGV